MSTEFVRHRERPPRRMNTYGNTHRASAPTFTCVSEDRSSLSAAEPDRFADHTGRTWTFAIIAPPRAAFAHDTHEAFTPNSTHRLRRCAAYSNILYPRVDVKGSRRDLDTCPISRMECRNSSPTTGGDHCQVWRSPFTRAPRNDICTLRIGPSTPEAQADRRMW